MDKEKRYREATPLADRDDYQAWQKQRDEEEAMSAEDKFRDELDNRNVKIYNAWKQLLLSIRDHGFQSGDEGFDEFFDTKEGPYLLQTGYFDSFSFYTPGFDIHDNETGGVGIGVWYKDGEEAGGDVFKEFIPKLKKNRGAEMIITGAVFLPYGSKVPEVTSSEKQQLNLYTKDMVADGYSRKGIAGLVQFMQEVIDGNAGKYFPGAKHIEYTGLEDGRPSVTVAYDVPVIPDIDSDKTYNIVRAVEKLSNEFIYLFI